MMNVGDGNGINLDTIYPGGGDNSGPMLEASQAKILSIHPTYKSGRNEKWK